MTSVVVVVMLIMVVMLIWLRCLTTRAAAELPIDTSRVVKVRTNHVQAARLEDRSTRVDCGNGVRCFCRGQGCRFRGVS